MTRKHLIFGAWGPNQLNTAKRVLLICSVLLMEVMLTGIAYLAYFDVSDYEVSDFTFDPAREFSIGLISAFAGLLLSLTLVSVFKNHYTYGKIFTLGIVTVSTVMSVFMSLYFNKTWSLTWLCSFVICAAFDLVINQMLIMCLASSLFSTKTVPARI